MQIKNSKPFKMMEKLLSYNLEANTTPGIDIKIIDFGSRSPLTKGDHREFRIRNNEIGMKVEYN